MPSSSSSNGELWEIRSLVNLRIGYGTASYYRVRYKRRGPKGHKPKGAILTITAIDELDAYAKALKLRGGLYGGHKDQQHGPG